MNSNPKKIWKFPQIRQEGLILTPALVLGALVAAAVLVGLGIFVNRGFLFALVIGILCFGRFVVTGSCPLLRLFRR